MTLCLLLCIYSHLCRRDPVESGVEISAPSLVVSIPAQDFIDSGLAAGRTRSFHPLNYSYCGCVHILTACKIWHLLVRYRLEEISEFLTQPVTILLKLDTCLISDWSGVETDFVFFGFFVIRNMVLVLLPFAFFTVSTSNKNAHNDLEIADWCH